MTETAQAPAQDASTKRLSGRLGAPSIVLMVLAAAAPLSVIGGQVPLGFMIGNGVGMPAMFLVAAAILLLFAVGFTHMTKFIPKTGAFFLYVSYGIGRPVGLAAAYLSIFSYLAIQVGLVAYLGAAVADALAAAGGPTLPWWMFALVGLGVVGAIGLRNIGLSSRLLGVLLLLEIAVVVVVAVVVTATGGAEGLSLAPFEPVNVFSGAPALGLMFALAAFLGFESTAIFRDEARDPNRTIPRATYAAVILVGIFYAFGSWALVMAWGVDNVVDMAAQFPATLIMETARVYLGPVAEAIMNALVFTSVLAATLSFHNVITRYFHSLGSHGLLPARLAVVHPRRNAPAVASLVTSAIGVVVIVVCAVFGLNPMTQVLAWASGLATSGLAALMAVTALAVIVFFRRTGLDRSPWRTRIAPALGFVGLAAATTAIVANFPLLVGDLGADGKPHFGFLSIALLLSLWIAPIAGVVQALRARRHQPAVYAAITNVEDEEPVTSL